MKIKVRGKNAETAMPEYLVPFEVFTITVPDQTGDIDANDVNVAGNLDVSGTTTGDTVELSGGIGLYGTSVPAQQSLATAAETDVDTLSSPGSPTYTVVFTGMSPVGFQDVDTALTFVQVVRNLQDRVNELEAALQAYGILA